MFRVYDFDKFFDIAFKDETAKIVSEDDKSKITIDLPGYKKSGIKITFENGNLFVKVEGERGKKTYKFSVTEIGDIDNISSTFEDGVLTILVPKKKENVRTIEIK